MTAATSAVRSRKEPIDLHCPACGADFPASVWLVVDREERPDLLHRLLENKLDTLVCPSCGSAGQINHPLLFHDGIYRRLWCAMPLSIESPAAARSLVGDLLHGLIAALPPEHREPYLQDVELVPELDGLRAALLQAARDHDPRAEDRLISEAVGALLNVAGGHDFLHVFAEHRALLVSDASMDALHSIQAVARADGDQDLVQRTRELLAVLTRFRATLDHRRSALLTFLERMSPLSIDDMVLLEPVRSMLVAVDPQAVYAARIALSPEQRAAVDRILAQLLTAATAANDEHSAGFVRALLALPDQ
ncbi:MAG: hypothetical protein NVS4B8_05630 [Herpetosiphon sp.]